MATALNATTTVIDGLVRNGSRGIINTGTGTAPALVLMWCDGGSVVATSGMGSRRGAGETALCAAATVFNVSAATSTMRWGLLLEDGNTFMFTSGSNHHIYQWTGSAWTQTLATQTTAGLKNSMQAGYLGASGIHVLTSPIVADASAGKSWTWAAVNNATAFSAVANAPLANAVGTSSNTGGGLVALLWNGRTLALTLNTATTDTINTPAATSNLQYTCSDAETVITTGGAGTLTASNITSIGSTFFTRINENLSGVIDSTGHAWIAYYNNTNLVLRVSTATSGTDPVFSAETVVTGTTSTDTMPCLSADNSGRVYLFWATSALTLKWAVYQQTAGAISEIQAPATVTNTSGAGPTAPNTTGTKAKLNVTAGWRPDTGAGDGENAYLVWQEGTATPWSIMIHTVPYLPDPYPAYHPLTLPAANAVYKL